MAKLLLANNPLQGCMMPFRNICVRAGAKIPIMPVESSLASTGGANRRFVWKDGQEITDLRREGLSPVALSKLTGYDRKTIRNYLVSPIGSVYGPRLAPLGKLEPFKPTQTISERTPAGRGVERSGVTSRVVGTQRHGRIHDPSRLAAASEGGILRRVGEAIRTPPGKNLNDASRGDRRCNQQYSARHNAPAGSFAGMRISLRRSRSTAARPTRMWMASGARWRAMGTFRGKAAGIRCRGG
jgi:hypothetical protein